MRDVKAVPPGNVGASVLVWADAARKVLALVRSRSTSLLVSQSLSQCPTCGSADLQRSYVRFYERPRKALAEARPYRCGSCHRRVWGNLPSRPADAGAGWPEPDPTPSLDLSEVDRALERH